MSKAVEISRETGVSIVIIERLMGLHAEKKLTVVQLESVLKEHQTEAIRFQRNYVKWHKRHMATVDKFCKRHKTSKECAQLVLYLRGQKDYTPEKEQLLLSEYSTAHTGFP